MKTPGKSSKGAAFYLPVVLPPAVCGNCTMFRPPHSCTAVGGTISPRGWCRFYNARK